MKPPAVAYQSLVLAASITMGLISIASADEIKVGRIWYRNVTIEAVENGQIVFVVRSGAQRTADLAKVAAIRINAYPQVSQFTEAAEKGDDKLALSLLLGMKNKVRQSWLRDWLAYHRMHAAARRGEPRHVVDALLELCRQNADKFYFADPPVQVMQQANIDAAKDSQRRLAAALRMPKRRSEAIGAVKAMLQAAKKSVAGQKSKVGKRAGTSPGLPLQTPRRAAPAVADKTDEALGSPAPSAITLPRILEKVDKNDSVTELLRRGAFDDALRQADQLLKTSSRNMPRRLFQRGIAKRFLAQHNGDISAYKTAALDFMRIVIYFPRSTGFVGPSLLETADVHLKINRPDIASSLLDQADLYLGQDEPKLRARLVELKKKVTKDNEVD